MDYFEISEPKISSEHTGCFPSFVLFILENHDAVIILHSLRGGFF
jgi:hypothetical protein